MTKREKKRAEKKHKKLVEPERLHPGQLVKSAMQEQNLSQRKLAKLCGVSDPTISKLVHGKARLSPELASQVGSALELPAEELLDMNEKFYGVSLRIKRATPYERPWKVRKFHCEECEQIHRERKERQERIRWAQRVGEGRG